MNYFKRLGWITVLSSIIMIIAGVLFCVRPFMVTETLTKVIGIMLIANGVLTILHYFSSRALSGFFLKGNMARGILLIIIGIFVLTHVDFTVAIFSYIFSFYIIVDAISGIENSFLLKNLGASNWFINLILSCVLIAAGVYMLFNPSSAVATASVWMGIILILDGVESIVLVARIRSMGDRFYRNMRDMVDELRGNIIDEAADENSSVSGGMGSDVPFSDHHDDIPPM